MIHPSVLADEFSQRWERIRKSMLQQGADAMLVTDNVNLYYVSGRVFAVIVTCLRTGNRSFSFVGR